MKNKVFSTNRHSCYILKYHLVVVTKYRHDIFNNKSLETELFDITKNIFNEKWNCKIINMNTDGDHIHILFESSPQIQLSKLINNYKTVTSRLLRKKFSNYLNNYYWKPYFWSDSYYVGAISDTTEQIVSTYINNQKGHN